MHIFGWKSLQTWEDPNMILQTEILSLAFHSEKNIWYKNWNQLMWVSFVKRVKFHYYVPNVTLQLNTFILWPF